MSRITGGKRVGNNLFYSFKDFSIAPGTKAIFANTVDIQNILVLVTGSEISVIDGLLKTSGSANFFLLNPNGIVFKTNAFLDLGGLSIATTANSIYFADGTSFSADKELQVSPTSDFPIRLSLNKNSGMITVNGRGNQIGNKSLLSPIEFGQTTLGLSVKEGKTLALIGNGLNFNSGVVTTEGGDI